MKLLLQNLRAMVGSHDPRCCRLARRHAPGRFSSCYRVAVLSGLAMAGSLLGGSPPGAHAAEPIESPDPQEWSGRAEILEYLGQVTVVGPSMRLPPLGPEGEFHFGRINGGTATGPVLRGEILPAGEDWGSIRRDGEAVRITVDVRFILKSHDGAYVKIRYEARWNGSKDVFEKIVDGQAAAPTEYYNRSVAFFETTDPRYTWLNDIVAVGYGHVERGAGATMRFYKIK